MNGMMWWLSAMRPNLITSLMASIARILHPVVLMLALAAVGQDSPHDWPARSQAVISGASQAVLSWPVPSEHPVCRIVDVRIKDGDTIQTKVLFDAGVSVDLSVRLAPSTGRFNASDHAIARQMAMERLDALLMTGPVWVQLTGERSFERWAGRVYRREGDGVENVADRLRVEGFDVPRGQ